MMHQEFKLNKKGTLVFYMLIFSMMFLLGYSLFYLYNEIPGIKVIGASQEKILEANELAQRVIIYLDASVEVAATKASENLEKDGGFSLSRFEDEVEKPPCGTLVYPLLNDENQVDNCLVVDSAFQRNFEKEFNLLVSDYSEIPLNNYGFEVSTKKIGQTYNINVVSRENIKVPIYAFSEFYNEPVIAGRKTYSTSTEGYTENEYGYMQRGGLVSISRGSKEMDTIVIHYTVTHNVDEAYSALARRGLSYHYVIEKDGTIYQFIDEERAAQHAGCKGKDPKKCPTSYNQRSIGISLVSCGFNDPKYNPGCEIPDCVTIDGVCWGTYTKEQDEAVAKLLADIAFRQYQKKKPFSINDQTVIYHSDVDKGKVDPGPTFNKNSIIKRANEILKELKAKNEQS